MDIYLATEQTYAFVPSISIEVAQDRVEQKKMSLVVGAVGSLISRPRAEEIQMISLENRLEPFWLIKASARTIYDRKRAYTINVGGAEVQSVTVLGQEVALDAKSKDVRTITLSGTEHCLEERQLSRTFNGLSGERQDLERYSSFAKNLVVDVEGFAPGEVLVVPPQTRATAVVRQVLAELIKPVQQAQVIHEERVDVEAIELNFRPVYALEYEWGAKGKRNVVEFDALTGEMHTGGKRLSTQIKSAITRDLLFDISADAASMLVPGGGIAVKIVKAVVDSGVVSKKK